MPRRIIKPFDDFFKHEAAGGIILVILAAIAITWANSPLAKTYEQLWNYKITIGYGHLALSKSLLHWINDGLMALFFFVVGMEIKRELVVGELKSFKKAILPVGAALGGMIVPALIYVFFNHGTAFISGWGIPMATDIAFALGIISLLGTKKAPKSLAIFLTALAIIDDFGAIVVIALFYTEQLSLLALATALGILLVLVLVNKMRLHSIPLFLTLGFLLWLATLKSGVHATIAGVLLGLTIPVRSGAKSSAKSMLNRLVHALHPWVAFGIMPVFALANAGVAVDLSNLGQLLASPVSLGIIAGLFIGKQVGVFGAAYLMVRFKVAALPERVTIMHLYGASILAGIGFTMSLFITTLAFQDEAMLAVAKTSIILASMAAAIVGLLVLSLQSSTEKRSIEVMKGKIV